MKKFLKSLSLGLVVAFVGVLLCGCTPMNIEKAEAKLKDAGYAVVAYEKEAEEGIVGGITATKISLMDASGHITAILFDNTKSAKSFYEKYEETENIELSGKWVYWGTENAIEVFKS